MRLIDISDLNVRRSNVQEGIDELAESIHQIGLQQPVVVFRRDGRYQLIVGQRRYLACKKLGLDEIPALVTQVTNDTEAALLSFSENIHRLDLGYRDKMTVAVALLEQLGSVARVAKRLGVSKQSVRSYLGYAGVPESLKRMVEQGRIGATTAIRIADSVPDEKKAVRIAEAVVKAPSGDRRRMIVDAAHENPDRTAEEIVALTKNWRYRRFTVHLTQRIAQSLAAACRDYSTTPELVAQDALEGWLHERGFL